MLYSVYKIYLVILKWQQLLFVSNSFDNSIKIWNLDTSEVVMSLTDHSFLTNDNLDSASHVPKI